MHDQAKRNGVVEKRKAAWYRIKKRSSGVRGGDSYAADSEDKKLIHRLEKSASRWSPFNKYLILHGVTEPSSTTSSTSAASIAAAHQKIVRDSQGRLDVLATFWVHTFGKVTALGPEELQAMRQVAGWATRWDFQNFAPPTVGTFQKVFKVARNSAPGKDGLPYEAWKRSGIDACQTLFEVGQWLASGFKMGISFNDCVNVFPPKNSLEGDDVEVLREPKNTRPLGLKNADNKLVCSAWAFEAREPLAKCACSCQNGFVPGRQLSQHLVDIDAHSRAFSSLAGPNVFPILASWDYEAAFPSVLHAWMHFILPYLGFPKGFCNLVEGMYVCVMSYGDAEKCMVFLFLILSGVIQGCPLSGLIFVASIDPILAEMKRKLDDKNLSITRACADDIAAALRDRASLAVYAHIFSVAKLASGLSHNMKKCVLVPLWAKFSLQRAHVLKDWLATHLPHWNAFQIAEMVKLLGAFVGPAVHGHSWTAPLEK